MIECFLIVEAGLVRRWLRRYSITPATPCVPPYTYHNAMAGLGDAPTPPGAAVIDGPPSEFVGDSRWPVACERCPYAFAPTDARQVFTLRLYRAADARPGLWHVHEGVDGCAPPGAMWDAAWMSHKGPDGQSLTVMTPAGTWHIDHLSQGGGRWTRTGTPPRVTVRPSIGIGTQAGGGYRYHGFLTDGRLESV